MTLLDDDIDDLLQAFRADEAHIDHAIRARIWDRVCDAAPEAPAQLDTLDRGARVRRLRPRAGLRPRARVLAVAAAVLVLLAVGGLSLRSGPDDDAVTAGPASTAPLPRTLDGLADVVADLPTTLLGSSGDATYAYRRGIRSTQSGADSETPILVEQQWIAPDGSGRQIVDAEGDDRSPDESTGGPGTYDLGLLPPRVAIGLPDDVDIIMTTIERDLAVPLSPEVSPGLIDTLTYAGLPGPARAGLLRALDRLGFDPVTAPGLGPSLLRVEGPGPAGSTMQADLDLRTGGVTALARIWPGGGFDRLSSIEVDLRRDTQGS